MLKKSFLREPGGGGVPAGLVWPADPGRSVRQRDPAAHSAESGSCSRSSGEFYGSEQEATGRWWLGFSSDMSSHVSVGGAK